MPCTVSCMYLVLIWAMATGVAVTVCNAMGYSFKVVCQLI